MAESEVAAPVLGVSWDGTGYGPDGTVWGGEFFVVTDDRWDRVAHFRRFPLAGGQQAIKEPRRAALSLLYEMFGDAVFAMNHLQPIRAFSNHELSSIRTVLARGLNTPLTSSAGRLFDVVGSLTGIRHRTTFEGQTAMELEFALEGNETEDHYPIGLVEPEPSESASAKPGSPTILDWTPLVEAILSDLKEERSVGQISARFHNGLVEAMIMVAQNAGLERLVLSGGCFQNRYLTERAIRRLAEEGFHPYWQQRVPPNDGGICLGQVEAALQPGYCSRIG